MDGISWYEKLVMGLAACLLVFLAGYFLGGRNEAQPYQVSVAQNAKATVSQETDTDGPDRPDSLLEGEVIDLNTASVHDLERLPGIGEKRAQDIVAYRQAHGPFSGVDELDQVSGIGEATLEALRAYIRVG